MTRLRLKSVPSLPLSLLRKIRKAFSRRIGVICVTRVKIYFITRPNRSFLKILFWAIYKINWLYISVACVIIV